MTESRQPQDPAIAVTWLCECGTQVKSDSFPTQVRRESQRLCVEGIPHGDGGPGTHRSSGCGLALGIPLSLQGLDEGASHMATGRGMDERSVQHG